MNLGNPVGPFSLGTGPAQGYTGSSRMQRSTCASEQELLAFLVGELPEVQLNAVAEHLEECPQCEAAAQRLGDQPDPLLVSLRASGLAFAPARPASAAASAR